MGVFFDQVMEKDCELEHSPHKAVVRLLSVGTGGGGGTGRGVAFSRALLRLHRAGP